MFDLGMMELLVIGVTALIVVGPKDLPVMFRTVGRFTGKMKGMAREFSRAMNEAADETGVRSINADLRKMTNPSKLGLDTVRDAAKDFAKFDMDRESDKAAKARAEGRGPAVAKMTEERAEAARKIREKSAEVARARLAREAEAAEMSEEPEDMPEPDPGMVQAPPAKPAAKPEPAAEPEEKSA